MTIIYAVALDKNGDGFVNTNANNTHPPNLLPTPVTYTELPFNVDGANASLSVQRALFPYGVQFIQARLLSTTAGKLVIGTPFWGISPIDSIAVSAGQTYTVAFWLRGSSGYSGVPLTLDVYDQTATQIATTGISATDDWVQHTLTFTPSVGMTHIAIVLDRPAGALNVIIEAAGFMLVAGNTAPTVFNSGDDLDDFITDDVHDLKWRLGMSAPYERTPAPTQGIITVNNASQRYSPESANAQAFPGRKLVIQATYDGTTHTLLMAFIHHIDAQTGTQGERLAVLHLESVDALLQRANVLTGLFSSAGADAVIAGIVNTADNAQRGLLDADTGLTDFAYVGDTWRDGVRADVPIQAVTEAERGRFFVDRFGRYVFRNRAHKLAVIAPESTLNDNFTALNYEFGADAVNVVRVAVKPRSVGATGTPLWTLGTAQKIAPGSANARQFTVRLRDANDRPTGAIAIIPPVATTDFAANTASDGTGTNVTASFTVTVIATHGSAVTLSVQNNTGADAYLLAGARLRGTPLLQHDPMIVEARDQDSISEMGVRTRTFDLPFLVSLEDAGKIARYELARRQKSSGVAREVTLHASDHPAQVLARTLLDIIQLEEAQTNHDAPYFILAEAHHISYGGTRHTVTWTLEPANPGQFWTLNVSQLNHDTYTGYLY